MTDANWPPRYDDPKMMARFDVVGQLTPTDIYGWVCIQLGATRDGNGDARRWFAVRDALGIAVSDSGKP